MEAEIPTALAVPRLGRKVPHGTVALIDRASICVAELAMGPAGVRVRRHALVFNGKDGIQFLDSDPDSVVAMLARVVREHGFSRRIACIGLFESMFAATQCKLARTTPAATSALLERRVREQIIEPTEDLLSDHTCVSPVTAPPDEPLHVLLAWASRAQLERYARAFRRERLSVERVVPPSVALLDLFGRTRPDEPDRIELFTRYCYPSLVIGVHRGGLPLYLRFLPDLMADAEESVVSTILNEVRRTATFVAESHMGRMPAGVTYSGLTASDGARFEQRLKAEVGLVAHTQQVALDGADAEIAPERLAALTGLLVHGAPLAGKRVRAMNLLPKTERPLAQTAATLAVLAVITMITAFASLGVARHSVQAVSQEIHQLEADFAAYAPGLAERHELIDVARRADSQRATMQLVQTVHGNPVQPLLETLLLLPDETLPAEGWLNNAYAVGTEVPRLELRLRGDFSGPRSARLAAFTDALKARPWCASLTATRGAVRVSPGHDDAQEDVSLGLLLQ